jgi:hypothetical protein
MTHKEEIENSRYGGFGGSDARMFLTLAKVGSVYSLAVTAIKRIAVALGTMPYEPTPETEAMAAGHTFEDLFAVGHPELEREKVLESKRKIAGELRIFAHADFVNKDGEVYELKYSEVFNTSDLINKYQAQLQWYYMLGVPSVHIVTTEGVFDVEKDEETIGQLCKGIDILDQALQNGFNPLLAIEGQDDEIDVLMNKVAVWKQVADDAARSLKEATEKLQEMMSAKRIRRAEGYNYVATLTAPTTQRRVDSKKLQADYPDVFAAVTKEVEVKGSLRITKKDVK